MSFTSVLLTSSLFILQPGFSPNVPESEKLDLSAFEPSETIISQNVSSVPSRLLNLPSNSYIIFEWQGSPGVFIVGSKGQDSVISPIRVSDAIEFLMVSPPGYITVIVYDESQDKSFERKLSVRELQNLMRVSISSGKFKTPQDLYFYKR